VAPIPETGTSRSWWFLKFLVDNALSPFHWGGFAIGGLRLDLHPGLQPAQSDRSRVFARAAEESRVMISADTDFGTLLALRNEEKPSVILLGVAPNVPVVQCDYS